MRQLIINNVSIISPDTKKAKYQEFKEGINLVIGDRKDGNFIGKSSLLRSIFHTLGADSKYNKSDWEKEGPYIYLLDFTYNNKSYIMMRKQELFKLFENGKMLFSVINRENLADELSKVFLDRIYLLNYEKQYSLAHPAYSYVLNYIEQTEIKLCEFKNFNSLTSFPSTYYNDLLYELVGSNNKEYNDIVLELKQKEDSINNLNEKENYLNKVLEEISKSTESELSTDDMEVLKASLNNFEKEYSVFTENANKLKKELYKAYSLKSELEVLVNEIKKSIKKNTTINNKILSDHICPTCHTDLEDSKGYFVNSNNIENYKFQLIDLE